MNTIYEFEDETSITHKVRVSHAIGATVAFMVGSTVAISTVKHISIPKAGLMRYVVNGYVGEFSEGDLFAVRVNPD